MRVPSVGARENAGEINMKNIYKFKKEEILKIVPDKKGIYFLGNLKGNKFVVGYVGRSDFGLKKRLLSHNHLGKFKFFSFQVTKTKREAFMLETEYWYLLRESTINRIHPNVPQNIIMEHPCDIMGRVFRKRVMEAMKNG